MTVCRFNGSTQPRTLPGRHREECPNRGATGAQSDERGVSGVVTCPGCLPCPERHCTVCSKNHAEGACPECLDDTRNNLHDIATMSRALPTEAIHRGINGEAMMLHGPAADPEAWRNRATSAIWGRLDAAYLEDCRDELHPLWVLGSWEQLWRDHLNQPTDLRVTLPRLVAYLDKHMSHMATLEEPPFDDFARDLRDCRTHLQNVLGDQSAGDRANVGCFDCGGQLERKLRDRTNGPADTDRGGFEDQWTCRRCRRKYTIAEYNFALRASLETHAAREQESA